jgi:hypothetical protein
MIVRCRGCGVVTVSTRPGRMSSDVIIGQDGKPRWAWAGTGTRTSAATTGGLPPRHIAANS